jgi:hypothetical protein
MLKLSLKQEGSFSVPMFPIGASWEERELLHFEFRIKAMHLSRMVQPVRTFDRRTARESEY